jgi:glycosyltransferase involved in cell wall biosynthesis
MNQPLISVVMSVYKEPLSFLQEAVDSILGQTLQDKEFIIINDNPENPNLDYLKLVEIGNSCVKLICNKENLGLPASLNIGVKAAKGKYIARMDADDISLPNRLDEQLKYLIDNNYDLVGCYIERIDESGKHLDVGILPQKPRSLKRLLPYATIAFHPTWFAKAKVLKDNPYNTLFVTSQDYELLHRLIRKDALISNLNQPLLKYRINPDAISSKKSYLQFKIHNFVNEFDDLCELNIKIASLLNDNNDIDEYHFTLCREKIIDKKIKLSLIPCLFRKPILNFIYKIVMSRLVKRYG